MSGWSPELFALDPEARVQRIQIGRHGHPLVIVDGFYRRPERIAALARALPYSAERAMTGEFPGGRAFAPLALAALDLVPALTRAWGAPLEPVHDGTEILFSAIPPDARPLDPRQRQPHVDPGITALIYLTADEHAAGGTAFYRHCETGLERLPTRPTPSILALARARGHDVESFRAPGGYRRFLDELFFDPRFAAPEGRYINDGNQHWERLHLVQMRWNRLLIFDGQVPHSQYLLPEQRLHDLRLTQTFYLRERPHAL